jgi:hypothetical protein
VTSIAIPIPAVVTGHEPRDPSVRVIIKVQRVRVPCVQCGGSLGTRCAACRENPERSERVVEYYDWPEILEVCPCKCSVRIRCQRPGCEKTMWRNCRNTRRGLSRSASLFCSPQCNCAVQNAAKRTSVLVDCACGCGARVRRTQHWIKQGMRAYANPSHYFAERRRLALQDAEQKRAARLEKERLRKAAKRAAELAAIAARDAAVLAAREERLRRDRLRKAEEKAVRDAAKLDARRADMACYGKCGGAITEHLLDARNRWAADCQVCGNRRSAGVSVMQEVRA